VLKKLKNIPAPRCFYTELAENGIAGILLIEDVSKKGKSMGVSYIKVKRIIE
jgi:hypothetical protein